MIMSACTVLFSFIGLFALICIIAKIIRSDFTEIEAVDDAEWIIADHCNSIKDCEDCDNYLRKEDMCKYRKYAPWNWRKRREYK